MSAEGVIEAANATLFDQVLVGLVTDACSITFQRVIRHAAETAKRKNVRPTVTDYLQFDPADFHPSLAALALIPDFPSNGAEVRAALTSAAARTVVRQVTAATLLDEYLSNKAAMSTLLQRAFAEHGIALSPDHSAALLDAVHSMCAAVVERTRSSPDTAVIAEQAARTVLMQATVQSIAVDLADLRMRTTRERGDDDDWLQRYRAQCVAKHGYITPPDNNKRTTVALEDIYVPGRLHAGTDGSAPETVLQLATRLDRHVILGDPGGGKSTATNAIAHHVASSQRMGLPFVVILRDYGKVMNDESIATYIERTISARYEVPDPPTGLIEETLRQGGATILLDGLDELLDPTKRRAMSEKVELFSKSYPSVSLLVTSRRVGYNEARLDPLTFRALELSSHTNEDVASYVSKWFQLNAGELQLGGGATVDHVVEAFLEESASIEDLRSNPLLLALLCIIYRGQNYLPRNRVGIYEKCTELLFETWDRSRGLTYDFSFDAYLDDAIKHLALWMFLNSDQDAGVTENSLISEIARFFAAEAYETSGKAAAAAKAFIGFCKGRAWVLAEAGLTPDGTPLFTFAHRTFMEFYAAAQLTRKYPDPEKLALQLVKHVSKNEWDTVGQLAVQLINRSVVRGAERTISKLISYSHAERRTIEYRAATLYFIGRCMNDLPPAPALLRLAFPRLLALADDVFMTQARSVIPIELESAIGSLYRQDASGEEILFSELREYVISATHDPSSRRYWAGLFVIGSCINRRNPLPAEVELYREAFLASWTSRSDIEYETLRVAYFANIVEVNEIAEYAQSIGQHILDPWYDDTSISDPHPRVSYYCMAFPMVNFCFIWTSETIERYDRESTRWFGSLATEVGSLLRQSSGGPLITARQLELTSVLENLRPRGAQVDSSTDRKIAALIHACGFVEMLEMMPDDQSTTYPEHPVIDEARLARVAGAWAEEGYFASLEPSPIRGRLLLWAERRDSFVEI